MALITIPFDYGNLDEPNSIVPICINDTDKLGRKISWRWILAILPIADRLRGLARYRLGDEWRASELTDSTLHEVWCKHLNDFGISPSGRIWRNAKWKAEDLRAGGWRARQGIEQPLPDDEAALDSLFRFADPKALGRLVPERSWDFEKDLQRRQFLEALVRMMKFRGDVQAGEMLQMLAQGISWPELNAHFGKKPNTLTQNLHRAIRRALKDLRNGHA